MTNQTKEYHPANTFLVAGVLSNPGVQDPAVTSIAVVASNRQVAEEMAIQKIEGFNLISITSLEEMQQLTSLLTKVSKGEDVPLQILIEEDLPGI